MNSDEKSKQEEVGLPKSTLCNFIKEILTGQSMKGDKQIFDLLDKLTTKYVNHISNIASQICTEKGKKTLNVDHVIQALKQMNFDSHIKMLGSELDLSSIENEEKGKEIIADAQEMKELINKQKKKPRKKKTKHEFDEEMEKEQAELFERARRENMQQMQSVMLSQSQSQEFNSLTGGNGGNNNIDGNSLRMPNNKKMRLDIENDLFKKKEDDEEVDFD